MGPLKSGTGSPQMVVSKAKIESKLEESNNNIIEKQKESINNIVNKINFKHPEEKAKLDLEITKIRSSLDKLKQQFNNKKEYITHAKLEGVLGKVLKAAWKFQKEDQIITQNDEKIEEERKLIFRFTDKLTPSVTFIRKNPLEKAKFDLEVTQLRSTLVSHLEQLRNKYNKKGHPISGSELKSILKEATNAAAKLLKKDHSLTTKQIKELIDKNLEETQNEPPAAIQSRVSVDKKITKFMPKIIMTNQDKIEEPVKTNLMEKLKLAVRDYLLHDKHLFKKEIGQIMDEKMAKAKEEVAVSKITAENRAGIDHLFPQNDFSHQEYLQMGAILSDIKMKAEDKFETLADAQEKKTSLWNDFFKNGKTQNDLEREINRSETEQAKNRRREMRYGEIEIHKERELKREMRGRLALFINLLKRAKSPVEGDYDRIMKTREMTQAEVELYKSYAAFIHEIDIDMNPDQKLKDRQQVVKEAVSKMEKTVPRLFQEGDKEFRKALTHKLEDIYESQNRV